MKSGKKEQAIRAAREAKPLGIPFGPDDPTNEEVQPMVPVAPKEKAVKTKTGKKTGRRGRVPRAIRNGNGNGHGKTIRERIIGLARHKNGCTNAEVFAMSGWPSVSMPQVAESQGVTLRIVKKKGEVTRYFVAP